MVKDTGTIWSMVQRPVTVSFQTEEVYVTIKETQEVGDVPECEEKRHEINRRRCRNTRPYGNGVLRIRDSLQGIPRSQKRIV